MEGRARHTHRGRAAIAWAFCAIGCLWASVALVETPPPRAQSWSLLEKQSHQAWDLTRDGFKFLRLPLPDAETTVLQAGRETAALARTWRPIKNGDSSKSRRQSYLRMRWTTAPMSVTLANVIEATEAVVTAELSARGTGTSAMRLNDCVAIADFGSELPRQELHRDIRRDAVECSTHGVLVPLAHGVRLHAIPASHSPRGQLRGHFSQKEVAVLDVMPGWALVWDGMLVHAGDGAAPGTEEGLPNRVRLHGYFEPEGEDRPFDDKGDRSITESETS
eukprot:TRINITY_DN33349_c0_g1_i1.p1 TRINITY_DN33349_c0_g1~~TRINITY_DN33349_c0_g1_i1.p1  ORF type:complete len:289 (-),score=48.53 TRINITY_DN33349_c0_g1_i1:65-895(-)